MTPSVVGCSTAIVGKRPNSRRARAGFGPRATVTIFSSAAMTSPRRPSLAANPKRRRTPSPVDKMTASTLPVARSRRKASIGAVSGESAMRTMG